MPRLHGSRLMREQLAAVLARVSRPVRRVVTPRHFKEYYINRVLELRAHTTIYLEIGVREGESLRCVRAAHKVGIDPEVTEPVTRLEEGESYFQMTSDEFFSSAAREVLEPRSIDVALVDGLHEFRQALRDLLNLEPYMRRDGVVFLDDCNPRDASAGADIPTGGAWNGDVWKVAAFVTNERPDLRWQTIDADEGVGVVSSFSGDVERPSPGVIERYKSLTYEWLNANRREVLRLEPPSAFAPPPSAFAPPPD